ncbi:hypothetical protein [Gracilimonas tropica]|uniref:hypothetical protein n=1 Tax=Gracilimonas tropica TaxID=454600 RepID=UPI00036E6B2B|nr:hypothetical protein [Gracilimonas tropica]
MKSFLGFVLISILASAVSLYAQETRLEILAGPNFSTFDISQNDGFKSEMGAGTHIGVNLMYEPAPDINILIGSAFSEVNFDRRYKSINLGNLYDADLPDEIQLSYSFKMIELPVGLRYTFLKNVIEIGMGANIRPAFISGYKGEWYSQRVSENKYIQFEIELTDEIKEFDLFIEPGIDLRYALDANTSILGGIQYAFDVLGLYESVNETRRLHRVELSVGLAISLF